MDDEELARLDQILDGAALWGLELDTRYRVLAATLEPSVDRYPWGDAGDRRIQVLWFPVSTILAVLRRRVEGTLELQTFEVPQLVDVVAAFDGAAVSSPLFGRPEPRPGEWGPRFSLEGRSGAPDGTRRTVTLALRHDDIELDVFARFDEVEVKDPTGSDLAV